MKASMGDATGAIDERSKDMARGNRIRGVGKRKQNGKFAGKKSKGKSK